MISWETFVTQVIKNGSFPRVQNKYMMTPVSFITIKDTSLMHGHISDEFNNPSGTVGLLSVASSDTVPRALISQVLQSSELKPIKFRCRVIHANLPYNSIAIFSSIDLQITCPLLII